MLTKEQFRAQFDCEITVTPAMSKVLAFDRLIHGYGLYHCMDRLLLLDDGHFYFVFRQEDMA
jgi:hypothetical protein